MTAWAGTAIYGTKKAGAHGRMTKNVQDDRPISGGSLDRYDPTIHGDLRIVMIPRSRTTKGSWPGHDPSSTKEETTDYLNHGHYHVSSYFLFTLQ